VDDRLHECLVESLRKRLGERWSERLCETFEVRLLLGEKLSKRLGESCHIGCQVLHLHDRLGECWKLVKLSGDSLS
jgi:hypothetical protein